MEDESDSITEHKDQTMNIVDGEIPLLATAVSIVVSLVRGLASRLHPASGISEPPRSTTDPPRTTIDIQTNGATANIRVETVGIQKRI